MNEMSYFSVLHSMHEQRVRDARRMHRLSERRPAPSGQPTSTRRFPFFRSRRGRGGEG